MQDEMDEKAIFRGRKKDLAILNGNSSCIKIHNEVPHLCGPVMVCNSRG
jgi:hypothetical protein